MAFLSCMLLYSLIFIYSMQSIWKRQAKLRRWLGKLFVYHMLWFSAFPNHKNERNILQHSWETVLNTFRCFLLSPLRTVSLSAVPPCSAPSLCQFQVLKLLWNCTSHISSCSCGKWVLLIGVTPIIGLHAKCPWGWSWPFKRFYLQDRLQVLE